MTTRLADLYGIENYIDTFALGHYARVLSAEDRRRGETVAFKVMRSEHLSDKGDVRWEYRAFPHEADLLMRLNDSPQVVDLLDCGFVSTMDEAPENGEIESMGQDIDAFKEAFLTFAERRWRPYLTLKNLPRNHNLLYLMKPSKPGVRWRLPTEEGLALALQFAQMLKLAHSMKIIYMDHKLEHVYWDGFGLHVIDLNSSRLLANETGDAQYFRLDIHNLCVGILYPIFTGLTAHKTALRPQSGNINEVEDRYKDITTLDFGIEPTLSEALIDLLQRGANMQIETIDEFISALHEVAARHGWDFPGHHISPASRMARDHMREGLRKLREGQDAMRQARGLFREAAIQDAITDDLEDELRRLVRATNDMLNKRVIP